MLCGCGGLLGAVRFPTTTDHTGSSGLRVGAVPGQFGGANFMLPLKCCNIQTPRANVHSLERLQWNCGTRSGLRD